MNPLRLRLRVLTVLGLPALACAKQAQSAGDGEPPVLEIPPVASATSSTVAADDELDEELFTHAAARAFDCGPDHTRALLCGRAYGDPEKPAPAPYDRCDETARSVSHEVMVGRHPTPAPFDGALSARYRDHKTGAGDWCCYSQCTEVKAVASASTPVPGYRTRLECIVGMHRGTKFPADGRSDCPVAVDFGGGPDGHYAAPFNEENSKLRTQWAQERTGFEDLSLCCYQDLTRYTPGIRRGRALRDAAGHILVAPSRRSADWHDAAALDVEPDAAIAARWLRDAELEHASVASFAQLALALLACGAPPELVRAAHDSALDEIRHARICYALASAYAGAPLGPGPLAPPSLPAGDPVALAMETFVDGCVGETAAALVASRAAEGCELAPVRSALTAIAADEERHALFAWRIVAWSLRFEGVREALASACERLAAEPVPEGSGPEPLAAVGLSSVEAERRIRHHAITEVVLPCARALLDA